MDLRARYPQHEASANTGGSGTPKPFTLFGRDEPQVAQSSAQPAPDGGTRADARQTGEGYELNFENAPITTVAKVVLSDILAVGYTIDQRVQGTISLSSARPVSKTDILFLLENALRLSNVVLVRERSGSFRLMPAGEAVGSGPIQSATNAPEPGYGITVVPLRYVSVATIMKLLDSFGTKPGMLRAEPSRNLLLVQGNGAERRSTLESIVSFDVDWMRGQSVGIYPVKNAALETIIQELEKVLDSGDNGSQQNLIKFQPIARLNAIMVLTRKTDLLRTAGTWIARLDRTDTTSTGVRVYRVRYGDARQIAAILNDVFSGRSGGGMDSATNQLAPGGGVSTLSSGAGSPGQPSQSPIGMVGGGGATTPIGGASPSQGASGFDVRFAGVRSPSGGAASSSSAAPRSFSIGGGDQSSSGGPSSILAGVRITADTANNSLLIFANQENYRIIERTLRQIDRPQLQVSIDATIAEVTLNNELSYGVQYFVKSYNIDKNKDDHGSVGLFRAGADALLKRAIPGFNLLIGPEGNPNAIIDALRALTEVKVLSAPSVVVLDNQVATLLVGDQVPITTRTAVGVENPNAPLVSNIEYRNTGVILRVSPRINANGNILLDIEQEISNVAGGASASTLTPTVSQRKIKSTIAVATGQTVLLGGLIQERENRGRSGIPGLEAIPILGDVFAQNSVTINRTELIIFIRPQIIRDGVDAQKVAEELRSKLKGSANANAYPRPLGNRP